MRAKDIKNVKEMQLFVSNLYPNHDRDFSYIFGYTARHIGYLGKSLNQGKPQIGEFIRAISWIFSLANKIGIDIEDAIIKRHPGICPYCVTTPCKCLETGKKPNANIRAYNIPEELFHKAQVERAAGEVTLSAHATRLAKIYIGNSYIWRFSGPWVHTSKMQEELAEVHEAVTRFYSKRKDKAAVAEEFSDLLAWILSAWNISFPNDSIDEQFIYFYLRGCPVCGKDFNCSCQLYSDISSQLVESEKIKELELLFLSLAQEVGLSYVDIEEIRKSLNKAVETQSEPIARTALVEVRNKTKEIESMVDRGAKNTKNVTTIITALKGLFEGFSYLN